MSIVLVTGGSGFVGVHTILQLLAAGHEVRTTVRQPERNRDVLAMLREGGAPSADWLSFFTADLTQDAGWGEAMAGCDYVLHVASPLSTSVPRDENELIIPARDGTLRVLRASREAGVKRVVITSSTAAVAYGHKPQPQPFDESSWTNLDGGAEVQPYVKSKTLAERAAWDFIAREGGGLELSVVNPAGIFGPLVRLAATRVPLLRDALAQLGKVRRSSGAKARNVLGWTPRGNEEIITSTAESLIKLGLVKS